MPNKLFILESSYHLTKVKQTEMYKFVPVFQISLGQIEGLPKVIDYLS